MGAGGGGFDATDTSRSRSQRHTLALRDVAYLIRASVAVREGVAEDPAKFRDQFQRRVTRGQCFTQPYLGCREFSAAFGPPTGDERPIDESLDSGPDASSTSTMRRTARPRHATVLPGTAGARGASLPGGAGGGAMFLSG